MCKRSEASIDYLLLHCEVVRNLWSVLFTLFHVTWVMPERVIDLLACWRGQMGTCSALVMWRIAPLCLMWTIWRERNAKCFEDREKSEDEIKNILVKSLFNWTWAFNIFFRFLTSLFLWSFVFLFAFSGALSLYTCVLGLRPFALFNEMNYLYHLLIHCDYILALWQLMLNLF
jgi:hypothetical protein